MLDSSDFLAASALAVPLERRGRAVSPDPDRTARAERTLARWRAQRPFEQDDWFERRLAATGLDPALLRDLLREGPAELAGRLGEPEPWARRLAAAFAAPLPHDPVPLGPEQDFAALVGPLLNDARDRLRQGLDELDLGPLGGSEQITALLLPALTATAHAMAVRTMIVELHVARLSGQLTGATPQQRYRDFVDRLAEPDRALRLLAEYPVLARRLTTAAEQWTRAGLTLLRRLVADLPDLSRTFGDGAALGRLTEVSTGMGDPHRGGSSVTVLQFEHGARIVYKPRRIGAETHFQQLLRWINPQLRLPLRDVAYLPGDEYGWMEFLTPRHCAGEPELRDFYHRAGTLAALLYVTNAVDCHAQNLLAVGDQPVLVDLEALLHPDLREPDKELSPSERAARGQVVQSVLRSGLLPQRMWDEDGNGGADLSALGWDPAGLPPRPVATAVGAGTDELRIEYRRTAPEVFGSRPVPDGRALELARYVEQIDAGFTEAYRLLAGQKDELRGLLRAFADDETRLLRRDTLEYRSLLDTACHPDLLRDALDQDRHLDQLWALAAWEDSAGAFVEHERADLWNNDIPLFTIRPGSVDARSSSGALIPGITARPALDDALDKVDLLGPVDLERQRQLLRLSVTTADRAAETRTLVTARAASGTPAAPAAPGDTAEPDLRAVRGRALDKAVLAAEQLLREAYRGSGDLAWIGPNWAPPGRWTPAELGPDLYSGTAGIVLFLHELARLSGDPEHRTAATAATATLLLQTRRRADRLGGGMAGTGGLLYAVAHLTAHRPGAELDALAELLVARTAVVADDDELFDVISGSAGSIGGLAAWAAIRPSGPVTDALARCAARLADRARPQPDGGVGWIPGSLAAVVDRPLAGFAHGGSGIAWALAKAGQLLGDERLPALALGALDDERTLFDPAAGNWRDVREDRTADGPSFPVLWCHGAGGIALARVELSGLLDSPQLRAERGTALDTVLRDGFGGNFSLCHGDLGNLDTLLLAEETGAAALRQASLTLDALDQRGWVCGLPRGVSSPSLMVGVAGIGHGLLRLAAPDTVPSLLALRPPISS